MNTIQDQYQETKSTDDQIRLIAFTALLSITEQPVDWTYVIWDDLVSRVNDPNSYQRTIALLLLCNLAKSDPQGRMDKVLPAILAHTSDEKFITSRQCIQNVWKIAAAQPKQYQRVVSHLTDQFVECAQEKHANLLRLDILQSLRHLNKNGSLDSLIADLIMKEKNEKYRVSYSKA